MRKLTEYRIKGLQNAKIRAAEANRQYIEEYAYALSYMWNLSENGIIFKCNLLEETPFRAIVLFFGDKVRCEANFLNYTDVVYAVDNKVTLEKCLEYWNWLMDYLEEEPKAGYYSLEDYIKYPPETWEEFDENGTELNNSSHETM